MIIIFGFLEAFYKYCNHWVEIIMVFSSAWYFLKHDCVMWASCNFSVCESLPTLLPPFFLVPSDDLKPVTLALSTRPRTLVRRKQKCRCTLFLPDERSTPFPPPQKQGQSDTTEKLQFVRITSVWTPSMLSCLQVNLSWGICHGSSCFCI